MVVDFILERLRKKGEVRETTIRSLNLDKFSVDIGGVT